MQEESREDEKTRPRQEDAKPVARILAIDIGGTGPQGRHRRYQAAVS